MAEPFLPLYVAGRWAESCPATVKKVPCSNPYDPETGLSCQTFLCPHCERLVPWCVGSANEGQVYSRKKRQYFDNEDLCVDCWCELHPEKQRLKRKS